MEAAVNPTEYSQHRIGSPLAAPRAEGTTLVFVGFMHPYTMNSDSVTTPSDKQRCTESIRYRHACTRIYQEFLAPVMSGLSAVSRPLCNEIDLRLFCAHARHVDTCVSDAWFIQCTVKTFASMAFK